MLHARRPDAAPPAAPAESPPRLRVGDPTHSSEVAAVWEGGVAWRRKVVDTTHESFVFELTGAPSKIDKFIRLMRPLGLTELSRTGVLSITQPGVAGRRVERELARVEYEVVFRMLGTR